MTAAGEFFGGPLDGRLQSFPGEEPPAVVVMRSIGPRAPHVPLDDPAREVRSTYVRDHAPHTEGLWRLRYVPAGAPR